MDITVADSLNHRATGTPERMMSASLLRCFMLWMDRILHHLRNHGLNHNVSWHLQRNHHSRVLLVVQDGSRTSGFEVVLEICRVLKPFSSWGWEKHSGSTAIGSTFGANLDLYP